MFPESLYFWKKNTKNCGHLIHISFQIVLLYNNAILPATVSVELNVFHPEVLSKVVLGYYM